MNLADSCCVNCGQRDKCNDYHMGYYSDECRFYYPEEQECFKICRNYDEGCFDCIRYKGRPDRFKMITHLYRCSVCGAGWDEDDLVKVISPDCPQCGSKGTYKRVD